MTLKDISDQIYCEFWDCDKLYKSRKNLELKEKLLKADSILKKRYKYLSGRIHKEYDTKRPLTTKENIEYSLQQQKDMLTIFQIW